MLWLSAWVPDVPSSTWYPSGGAFATRAAPIMPPAPPAFSTITCWPKSSPRRGVKTRIRPSLPPPAARGITIVMGRLGQSWAAPGTDVATSAAKAATARLMIDASGDRGEIRADAQNGK
jgi:hypothetical protein